MSAWQPIETAPKQMVPSVLLYDGLRRYVGWYDRETDAWLPDDARDDDPVPEMQPTYWMPIPDLPEDAP